MTPIRNCFILIGCMTALFSCNKTDDLYLNKALEVEKWLNNQKTQTDHGEIWIDQIGKEKISLSLSSGVSSKALFYLDLFNATNNPEHLNEALIACKYIVSNLPQNITEAKEIRNATSLYGDITGSAFILMEAYRITNDNRWKTSAENCLGLLDSLSNNPDGRYWNKSSDVLVGSSGTGLFLLYLYKKTGDPRALKLAQEAAIVIEERAIINEDSIYWYINQDNEMNIPNFSHGAAGIGYFFSRLYEVTEDSHYLDISRQIANYLEIIALKSDDRFLLPYGLPDIGWSREYDIGWAHGPAGTARFFYKLWQVTQEEKWLELVKKCSNGIKASGLPESPNKHFGESPFPMDMRFGLGGVIDFYIHLKSLNILDENDQYLNTLVNNLDQNAIKSDSLGRYWSIDRYGFMRDSKSDTVTFTGYFYGAAGLGRLYIKLHSLHNNIDSGIELPDSPF